MSSLENEVFRLDERIILLFSDSSWETLHRIAEESDGEKPAVEVLLDMLARQVWTFYEENSLYLVTRSITLRGRVVSLPRGDFGCQIDEVDKTSTTMVTQAFRMGLKIESDWEIVTPQRGLPFPTTRGAYKLLEAIVAEDDETFPEIMPTDFVWPENKPANIEENVEENTEQDISGPESWVNNDFISGISPIVPESNEIKPDYSTVSHNHSAAEEPSSEVSLQDSIDRIVAQAKQSVSMESTLTQDYPIDSFEKIHSNESKEIEETVEEAPVPKNDIPNNYDILFEQIEAKVDQSPFFEIKPQVDNDQINNDSALNGTNNSEHKINNSFPDEEPHKNESVNDNSTVSESKIESNLEKNESLINYSPNASLDDFLNKDEHVASEPIISTNHHENGQPITEDQAAPILTETFNINETNLTSEFDAHISKGTENISEAAEHKEAITSEKQKDEPKETPFDLDGFFTSSVQDSKTTENNNDKAEVNRQSLIDLWIAQAKTKEQPEEPTRPVNPVENLSHFGEVIQGEMGVVQNTEKIEFGFTDNTQSINNINESSNLHPKPASFEDYFDFGTPNRTQDTANTAEKSEDEPTAKTSPGNQYIDWFSSDTSQQPEEPEKVVKMIDEAGPKLSQQIKIENTPAKITDFPDISDIPEQDEIPNLLESLEACGPAFMEALRGWEKGTENKRWEMLPSIVPLRILWVFSNIEEAKRYFQRASEQNSVRSVLFMDDVILEKQDGNFGLFYKERWMERYRKTRIDSEAETTRLRVLRTNIEQIKKSFQEYADYQEELLRVGVNNGTGNSQNPVEERPQLTRQRKELLYLLAKMQKVEDQLRKSIQASKDITSIVKTNYIELQESYLELIEQVAERERQIFQANAQYASSSSNVDLSIERNRNHLNEQIRAIDRFINDSYGSYFKNDPIWDYFQSKDSFGLNQTLTFRERVLESHIKTLSNWQSLMENQAVLLEPQIWFGICGNIESFHSHNYYPHIIISEFGENEAAIEPLIPTTWLTIRKTSDGTSKITPGGIAPPNDPMMLLEILSNQEENQIAKIIWEKQELYTGQEDSLHA